MKNDYIKIHTAQYRTELEDKCNNWLSKMNHKYGDKFIIHKMDFDLNHISIAIWYKIKE